MKTVAVGGWCGVLCLLTALLTQGGAAEPSEGRRVVIELPRAPVAGSGVALLVRVGALRRGARVLVLSDDGNLLGAISSCAGAPPQAASTSTILLPESAVRDGRVAVRLVLEGPRKSTRPAREDEVEGIDTRYYVPAMREPMTLSPPCESP